MNFDFSILKNPLATASIALRTVYVLHADSTYDVKKRELSDNYFVALRTIGGMGKVIIDGHEEITVLPETLLFFKHSDVRRYYCSSNDWDFWWFEFSSSELHNIPLNTLTHIQPVENESDDCKSCLELLRKNDPASSYLASATLSVLLYKWMLHFENKSNDNPHRNAIQKVLYYLKLNICENISVKEMADMAGLCERTFRNVFIKITGKQPKKYLESLRISMAEELLRNTPFSINVISEKLGYSSQFHFSRAFQKTHGVPPSRYRKENQDVLNI
jgi:AraC-like DNA-binding protein